MILRQYVIIYIMNLRKYVGHEPLIGLGATTMVFNDKNEILLNLRSDTNNWGIPGGGKEINETLEECAIRELKEETGYEGGEWEFFSTTAPNPAAMTNLCYTFVARGVFKSGEQSLEKTEDIDVCEMTEKELLEVMKSGQITQGDMLSPLWQWMYNLEVERKK